MVKIIYDKSQGFATFKPVYFPGGSISFWQQTSKWYASPYGVRRFCKKAYEDKGESVNYQILEAIENKALLNDMLDKLSQAEQKLAESDNNLRYIKALKSIKMWLDRLLNFPCTLPALCLHFA